MQLSNRLTNTVLIVEDDKEALDEMVETLHDYGLKVVGTSNGFKAISLAYEHRPALILMDYNLPGINGIKASSYIREMLPDSKVIIISASDNPCQSTNTEGLGIFAVMKKPLLMNGLANWIKSDLERLNYSF